MQQLPHGVLLHVLLCSTYVVHCRRRADFDGSLCSSGLLVEDRTGADLPSHLDSFRRLLSSPGERFDAGSYCQNVEPQETSSIPESEEGLCYGQL